MQDAPEDDHTAIRLGPNQEPYTAPYVRACERAESRLDHRGSTYSIRVFVDLAMAQAQRRLSICLLSVGNVMPKPFNECRCCLDLVLSLLEAVALIWKHDEFHWMVSS